MRIALLLLLLAVVAVGCGGDRDDRETVRKNLGEPDHIEYTEGPYSDIEIWTYFDYPIAGKNYEYRFQRNKNVCGGNTNWSLVLEREYTPATGEEEIMPRAGSSDNVNPIKP